MRIMKTPQVVYLLQEKVGDSPWQTLFYCNSDRVFKATAWADISPRDIAVEGFPVYRQIVSIPEKDFGKL
jgi:hypothetical protein